MSIALLALAGILSGGAYSMHKQGAARGIVVFIGLLAALALVGGILWLVPS
ncbi:hypothetical protein AB0J82_14140 [Asanoa sp. NPDC049518]|uniref:hypothetical protein n=1 Tax=unclassified Asanoa TaxID=2685164 RepID=UPI003448BCA8